MSIAPLETERLRIREFELADLEIYHRLKADAFGEDDPLDSTRSWLDWTVRNYRELEKLYQPPYGDYVITLRESGAFVGSVGLVQSLIPWNTLRDEAPTEEWFTTPEFGLYYAVFKTYRGQGYATEAAQAVIDQVFDTMHAQRIVATTEYDNVASQAVMRKLGMHLLRNPGREPEWAEVCGVLENPRFAAAE
jgi:RimJ/RimL family protein N-acetyltransferase